MSLLRDVAQELFKMFWADLRLSLAILVTVALAGGLHLAGAPGWSLGLVLILGTAGAIAGAILSAAGRASR